MLVEYLLGGNTACLLYTSLDESAQSNGHFFQDLWCDQSDQGQQEKKSEI